MSRFIFALLCVSFVAVGVSGEEIKEKKEPPRLHGKIEGPADLGFSSNIASDGQAATIIFDDALVSLDPTGSQETATQTAIVTKVFTLKIPYTTDESSLNLRMDIRGFLAIDPGATARLVVCAGSTTRVIDLANATPVDVKLKGQSKETLAAKTDAVFDDFHSRIVLTVPRHAAKPVCQITLFLTVERDIEDGGGALLVVDSLDMEIAVPEVGCLPSKGCSCSRHRVSRLFHRRR